MAIGDDLQGDVATALDEFGRAITIRKNAPGAYDPATGAFTVSPDVDTAAIGLLLGYSDIVTTGTLIKQGDRRCLLKTEGLTITPEVGDKVIVGSNIYSVVSFKTIELGGIVIMYTLQLRLGSAK